jgi:hypothetical protein
MPADWRFGGAGGLLTFSQDQVTANTTATARAFVATQVSLELVETASAERTARADAAKATAGVEAEATQAAATALAVGDEDKDGLSRIQEQELGTKFKTGHGRDGLVDGGSQPVRHQPQLRIRTATTCWTAMK